MIIIPRITIPKNKANNCHFDTFLSIMASGNDNPINKKITNFCLRFINNYSLPIYLLIHHNSYNP